MSIYQEITSFPPTYLYIKQHSITGLLYFGKTAKTYNKMLKYSGSGTYWANHLKIHNKHIETIWLCLFYDAESISEYAIMCSKQWDIVNARDINGNKIWANCVYENGLDGGAAGLSESGLNKISKTHKGKIVSSDTKEKLRISRTGHKSSEEAKLNISIALKSTDKNKGKHHSEERKLQIGDSKRGKVLVLNLETNEYEQIPLELFNQFKNTKYSGIAKGKSHKGVNAKKVTAFDLETKLNVSISKELFDQFKGIRYVGSTSGMINAFNLETKEIENISKEIFYEFKGIKYVGNRHKLARA